MCFNIEYSCHTITNIIHGRRLSFALMTFFFAFQFLGGGGPGPSPGHVPVHDLLMRSCDTEIYYRNYLNKA